MYRSASAREGQIYQVMPLGGRISSTVVSSATWTEFDPAREDLVWVQTPRVAGGRIVHTNTATFPDLADGAPVLPEHLDGVISVFPGQAPFGFDRDEAAEGSPGYVRFFYAVALDDEPAEGDPAVTATMTFMRGAR